MTKLISIILGIVLALAIQCLLTAYPVMWLWNEIVTDIFNLNKIDFWQALGLSTLCQLLFHPSNSSSKEK